jgi:2-oxoglutarate ferredoxin oxidoreductase subunit delta
MLGGILISPRKAWIIFSENPFFDFNQFLTTGLIMAKKSERGSIVIDRERCKGCYLCISVCPNEIISISKTLNQQGYYPAEPKDSGDNAKGCIGCALCATMCPDIAIEVYIS